MLIEKGVTCVLMLNNVTSHKDHTKLVNLTHQFQWYTKLLNMYLGYRCILTKTASKVPEEEEVIHHHGRNSSTLFRHLSQRKDTVLALPHFISTVRSTNAADPAPRPLAGVSVEREGRAGLGTSLECRPSNSKCAHQPSARTARDLASSSHESPLHSHICTPCSHFKLPGVLLGSRFKFFELW